MVTHIVPAQIIGQKYTTFGLANSGNGAIKRLTRHISIGPKLAQELGSGFVVC